MNRIDIYNSRQSWIAVETTKILGHMLRITVCRNAYDEQSYAKTDRWDGEKWRQVDRLPITQMPEEARRVSYVQSEDKVRKKLLVGIAFMRDRAQEFFEEVAA
jgi:hypothetical protein